MIEVNNRHRVSLDIAFLRYLREHAEEHLDRNLLFRKPYQLLRSLQTKLWMRENGTFFTDDEVCDCLFSRITSYDGSVYDPAAGCGDLILRYLERVELSGGFDSQIKQIARRVHACEIKSSFVRLMRLRLWLYIYWRVYGEVLLSDIKFPSTRSLANIFPGIVVGDGLKLNAGLNPDLILMNPPFQQVASKGQYEWSSGRVSLAAIFVDVMTKMFPRSRILAVLPDVIRAGTRYRSFRRRFQLEQCACDVFGRFDRKTDVDVFTVDFGCVSRCCEAQEPKETDVEVISDSFEVHVGSVVLFRDELMGEKLPFLCAESIPAGATKKKIENQLNSLHNPVKGPIVVVRRTSSPSDRIRCASSVVASTAKFHIDNHLMWLKPKGIVGFAKELQSCQRLHRYFQSSDCTSLVNERIRCRHLTVSVISNLPYKE